jgi:hypothetical protein
LKLAGAAEYLGLHPNTLKNLEKEGKLKPSYHFGERGDRMYLIADLDAFTRRFHVRLRKAKAMRKSKKAKRRT